MSNVEHEVEIVWVVPEAKALPFVREKVALAPTRNRKPKWPPHERLVAYAVVGKEARGFNRRIHRRVWVLHDTDPKGYADLSGLVWAAPSEGVLPSSVEPRQSGVPADAALRTEPVRWPDTFG
jgi:hypothetical protein